MNWTVCDWSLRAESIDCLKLVPKYHFTKICLHSSDYWKRCAVDWLTRYNATNHLLYSSSTYSTAIAGAQSNCGALCSGSIRWHAFEGPDVAKHLHYSTDSAEASLYSVNRWQRTKTVRGQRDYLCFLLLSWWKDYLRLEILCHWSRSEEWNYSAVLNLLQGSYCSCPQSIATDWCSFASQVELSTVVDYDYSGV